MSCNEGPAYWSEGREPVNRRPEALTFSSVGSRFG